MLALKQLLTQLLTQEFNVERASLQRVLSELSLDAEIYSIDTALLFFSGLIHQI